jgi:hypothetical protein
LANNPEIIGLNELALKSVDYEHQLRLAALERRLGVHQEAYTLWWDLQRKMFGAEAWDGAFACQEWWIKNNLYLNLTPDVRQAFRDAFVAVSTMVELRGEPRDDERTVGRAPARTTSRHRDRAEVRGNDHESGGAAADFLSKH